MLASLRTMNTMWLAPPVSVRTTLAKYTPEVAFAGTVQEPETAQLPQSMRPLAACVRQFGWFCGSDAVGLTVVILRAPRPP